MTNKILTIATIITTCIFVLCGCDAKAPTRPTEPTYDEIQLESMNEEQNALHPVIADVLFERITMQTGSTIYDKNKFDLYRDKYTDIVYICKLSKHEDTFTVMLKPDGSPMLYSEWVELYKGKTIEEIMVEPTEEVVAETLPEVTEEYTEPTEETYAADYSIDLDEWEEDNE